MTHRHIAGGGAIDVTDEGSLADRDDAEQLFERGHGAGTGIGLSLARSISEATDARLTLTNRVPTTFTLIGRSVGRSVDTGHQNQGLRSSPTLTGPTI